MSVSPPLNVGSHRPGRAEGEAADAEDICNLDVPLIYRLGFFLSFSFPSSLSSVQFSSAAENVCTSAGLPAGRETRIKKDIFNIKINKFLRFSYIFYIILFIWYCHEINLFISQLKCRIRRGTTHQWLSVVAEEKLFKFKRYAAAGWLKHGIRVFFDREWNACMRLMLRFMFKMAYLQHGSRRKYTKWSHEMRNEWTSVQCMSGAPLRQGLLAVPCEERKLIWCEVAVDLWPVSERNENNIFNSVYFKLIPPFFLLKLIKSVSRTTCEHKNRINWD